MTSFDTYDKPTLDTKFAGKVGTDDSRLSDARTPTAHASTHKTGGADALAPSDIGAVAAETGKALSTVTDLEKTAETTASTTYKFTKEVGDPVTMCVPNVATSITGSETGDDAAKVPTVGAVNDRFLSGVNVHSYKATDANLGECNVAIVSDSLWYLIRGAKYVAVDPTVYDTVKEFDGLHYFIEDAASRTLWLFDAPTISEATHRASFESSSCTWDEHETTYTKFKILTDETKVSVGGYIASTASGGSVTDLSSLFSSDNTSLETAVKEIVDDYLDDATTTTYPTSAS